MQQEDNQKMVYTITSDTREFYIYVNIIRRHQLNFSPLKPFTLAALLIQSIKKIYVGLQNLC